MLQCRGWNHFLLEASIAGSVIGFRKLTALRSTCHNVREPGDKVQMFTVAITPATKSTHDFEVIHRIIFPGWWVWSKQFSSTTSSFAKNIKECKFFRVAKNNFTDLVWFYCCGLIVFYCGELELVMFDGSHDLMATMIPSIQFRSAYCVTWWFITPMVTTLFFRRWLVCSIHAWSSK